MPQRLFSWGALVPEVFGALEALEVARTAHACADEEPGDGEEGSATRDECALAACGFFAVRDAGAERHLLLITPPAAPVVHA